MTVITLPFPPSVNNLFTNGKSGRFPSPKYKLWIELAGWELKQQRPLKVTGPVAIRYEFQKKDNRKRDLSNLIKAPEDLLVSHGIIEADDWSIVQDFRAGLGSDVEGVRITISPLGA